MFTGLIEAVGTVSCFDAKPDGADIIIATPLAEKLSIGDSLAVNGTCLTVAARCGAELTFHLLHQTMRLTNLGRQRPGARVNLERPLLLGDRLDGHLVSGHIDTIADVVSAKDRDGDYVLTIFLPKPQRALVIDKGSIAVNGVSLTVAALADDSFAVHLIPHTLGVTNLGDLRPGDPVNLEMDMIGKFVLRSQALG